MGLALVLEHPMEQIPAGLHAVARKAVPVDQFAPQERSEGVDGVGQRRGDRREPGSGFELDVPGEPTGVRERRRKLFLEVRPDRTGPRENLAPGDRVALELVPRLDRLKREKLGAEVVDAGGVRRDARHHGPRLGARLFGARALGGLLANAPTGQGEEEEAELSVLRLERVRRPPDVVEPAEGHVHPAEGSGLVVVPLGDHGIEVRQAGQQVEVRPGHGGARLGDRLVDVEVAALEHRPRSGVLLEEGGPPVGEVLQRLIDPARRRSRENRFENLRFGCQARSVLEQVEDRDALDQGDMQRIVRLRLRPFHRLDGLRPSVPVGGREDRLLEVRFEVVPIVRRQIPRGLFGCGRVKVGAEPVRLGRRQEAKGAAFVLSELPLGDRPQQGGHDRMQRPTQGKRVAEAASDRRPARPDRLRDRLGCGCGPRRTSVRVDGPADQLDNLVARRNQRNVRIAPLDLRPVVPRVDPQPRGVLREGLVEDADDHDRAFRAGRSFRELLEEVDVVAGPEGGGLEELA